MLSISGKNKNKAYDPAKDWFDDMVSGLRVDQLLLETDALEQRKAEVYDAMIAGDHNFMHKYARNSSTAFFIQKIVESYFIALAEYKGLPRRLGLDLSASKVLVWAEIKNDDEQTEDALILAAAKINNEFADYGFHISSTIVEEDDQLEIPGHYTKVPCAFTPLYILSTHISYKKPIITTSPTDRLTERSIRLTNHHPQD